MQSATSRRREGATRTPLACEHHGVDPDTARWLTEIDGQLAERLAAVGLIPKREAATLDAFLTQHIEKKEVKGATKVFYGHTRRNLVEFFGAEKRLADITFGDADDFETFLRQQELSEATVTRRCRLAKTFFNAAVRHRLLTKNPFRDVKGKVHGNEARQRFITREQVQKAIDACPDAEWRLLVALARYGGLRIPSEALSLKWEHVDWERDRITVPSPKTEHHEGKGKRLIPMFPELKPYLEEVWEQAAEGTEFVISKHRSMAGKSETGWKAVNLRTQFLKILRRAGLEHWPKLWQNMRSTRCLPMDRQQSANCDGALSASDRRALQPSEYEPAECINRRCRIRCSRGAKPGAEARRRFSHDFAAVGASRCELRLYAKRNGCMLEHAAVQYGQYWIRTSDFHRVKMAL